MVYTFIWLLFTPNPLGSLVTFIIYVDKQILCETFCPTLYINSRILIRKMCLQHFYTHLHVFDLGDNGGSTDHNKIFHANPCYCYNFVCNNKYLSTELLIYNGNILYAQQMVLFLFWRLLIISHLQGWSSILKHDSIRVWKGNSRSQRQAYFIQNI